MIKRAQEILHKEIISVLSSKTKQEFNEVLTKIAALSDIVDQTGDTLSADKIDELLKQAGFWGDLFSGMAGGGGAKLWDALKGGKLKESLGEIVKRALMAGTVAALAGQLIKALDDLPLIGPYLKEFVGAEKLKSLFVGVIGTTVSESDFANKLVDNSIAAMEQFFGFGGKLEPAKKEEVPGVLEAAPEGKEMADSAEFQIGAKAASFPTTPKGSQLYNKLLNDFEHIQKQMDLFSDMYINEEMPDDVKIDPVYIKLVKKLKETTMALDELDDTWRQDYYGKDENVVPDEIESVPTMKDYQ